MPFLYNSIRSFPVEKYRQIAYHNLAAYVLSRLEKDGIEGTYEHVTVAAHKMFPSKFSLAGFPEYPDGWQVWKAAYLDGKYTYKYVEGSKGQGWRLTEIGRSVADQVAKQLTGCAQAGKIRDRKIARKYRSRNISFVKEIERSEAYSKWRSGRNKEISRFDICDVLHGTLDTADQKLLKTLDRLFVYAEEVAGVEEHKSIALSVLDFLNFVKSNWELLRNA